jgi:prevent-host-death family protein
MAQVNVTGFNHETMSAREAKDGFGLMIDTARAVSVLIEKHERGVVVVVSVEEYERLSVHREQTGKDVRGFGGPSVKNPRSCGRIAAGVISAIPKVCSKSLCL